MRVYIKTYGCTLNQADGNLMESILKGNGAEIVDSVDESEVVLLNTCTVKKPTEQRTLHVLKKLNDSGKKIVVAGCMAGSRPDAIQKYAPQASIMTTSNIQHAYDAVSSAYEGKRSVFDSQSRTDKLTLFDHSNSIIAKVPVSDGCLSSCSFCETKYARGPLNSFSEELILKAIETSVRKGAKEIQLTSQDMGAYGADRKTNIAKLMQKIALIEGDFKVRVGMLNPEHLGEYVEELAGVMANDKFYKFVHLPVQSGSNMVLQHMKRRCTVEGFAEHVRFLREKIPGITIETDVIVGYPTESLSDFDQTIEMINEVRPDVTNISKYCARPHASSSRLNTINSNEMSRRSLMLSRIVRKLQNEINGRFVGSKVGALMTESTARSMNGRSRSYKQVVVQEMMPGIGEFALTEVYASSANVLYGKLT